MRHVETIPDSLVSIGARGESQRDSPYTLEDGCEGRDADSSSDEYADFEVEDVLGCGPERTIDLPITSISQHIEMRGGDAPSDEEGHD